MNKSLYKSAGKCGLFDQENTVSQLSCVGKRLESLSKVIDFELFRSVLEDKLLNHTIAR